MKGTHKHYKWEVLALLWMAYLLNQADRQVFNTVLPAIRDSLGIGDTEVGMIATIFNLCYAFMVPLGGLAGDRLSRKWVTTIAILFWSVATMFTGLATGVVMLILLRSVATGGGEAFFGPANYSLLGQYHTDTRARAMSIHQTSYYVGVILAGWLAGHIADKLGWEYSFIIFGAAGVVWGIVMAVRLKDKEEIAGQAGNDKLAGNDEVAGNDMLTVNDKLAGIGEKTVIGEVSGNNEVSGNDKLAVIGEVSGNDMLTVNGEKTVIGEKIVKGGEACHSRLDRESKPGIFDGFKTVFTTPTALVLTIGFSGFIFVITGYMTWVPAFLQEEFGQSQAAAGFNSMFWTYLAAFLGVLLAGTLSDKIAIRDRKVRMVIQGVGLILGAAFLFFVNGGMTLWLIYLCFAGWGFFRAFFDANIYTVLYDVTPARLHASCSSALITTGFAVGALAPVILGAMKESMGSLSATFPVLGAVWIVCGILMLIVSRTHYQKDYDKINK